MRERERERDWLLQHLVRKEQETLTVMHISLHVTFFLFFVFFVSVNIVCGPEGLCNGFVCHLGKLIPAIHHSSFLYVFVHIQNEDVYPPPPPPPPIEVLPIELLGCF